MTIERHVHDILDDYIDGTLTVHQQEEAENHLSQCAECRDELLGLRSVAASLGKLPKTIPPPPEAKGVVEARLFGASSGKSATKPEKAPARVWIVRLAAMLVVAVGLGLMVKQYMIHDGTPSTIQGEQTQHNIADSRPVPALTTTTEVTEEHPAAISTRHHRPRYTLRGIVKDSLTGQPLAGATVMIPGTTIGTSTDSTGAFVLANLTSRADSLRVSFVGHSSLIAAVDASKRGDLKGDLLLAANEVKGEEVVVTAQARGQLAAINQQRSSTPITSAQSQPSSTYAAHAAPAPSQAATLRALGGQSRLYKKQGAEAKSADDAEAVQDKVHSTVREFNTESYDRIYENEFVSPVLNPLSTFSIDVDVASYANVRRYLQGGTRPPQDAVRIEELVNYFSYNYPQPTGKDPVSFTTELAACPWNPRHQLLMVGVQGKSYALKDLPPSNLVFLLDVSGSMNEPNKLPLVKSSFKLLVKSLRPEDKVAIVVYAGSAGLILPSTPGSDKATILNAIENLHAGGSTAGGEGILLAYKTAKENFLEDGNNRVILATDGDFNVGVSSDGDLVRLIEEKRNDGIFLSVLGFGMGNYKDSKMEKLADKGNGNYAYIDNFQEAKRVLVGQMAGTLFTIAKDVKLQLEFNPAHVQAYRLIGYEDRMLNKEDFNDDKKDAGELGAGQTVTAFYEIVPPGVPIDLPTVDELKYQRPADDGNDNRTSDLMTLKLRYKLPDEDKSRLMTQPVAARTVARTSENFRFASSVVEFGLLLRDSKYKGQASYRQVRESARSAIGEDPTGDRSEFVRMVGTCEDMGK